MTPKEAGALISLGQLSGLEPDPSIAGNLRGAAEVYARVLTLAGADFPMAEAAMLAIVSEPWTSEYRRKLPTTGEIIGRTVLGRAAGHLGSDTDADQAWTDLNRRMQHLAGRGGPLRGTRELDHDDYRNDAMWAGLRAMGGARAWDRMDPADRALPAKWRAAYVAARVTSRGDAVAVRAAALALAPQTLLPAPQGPQ